MKRRPTGPLATMPLRHPTRAAQSGGGTGLRGKLVALQVAGWLASWCKAQVRRRHPLKLGSRPHALARAKMRLWDTLSSWKNLSVQMLGLLMWAFPWTSAAKHV